MKYINYFMIIFFVGFCNADPAINETSMLVQLQFIENDGNKTRATVVLLNETSDEKLTLHYRASKLSIVSLEPGIYSLYSYTTYGKVKVRLKSLGYKFEIKPHQINYVGDWVFTENWGQFMTKRGEFGVSFQTSFSEETIKEAFIKYPDLLKNSEFSVATALTTM